MVGKSSLRGSVSYQGREGFTTWRVWVELRRPGQIHDLYGAAGEPDSASPRFNVRKAASVMRVCHILLLVCMPV